MIIFTSSGTIYVDSVRRRRRQPVFYQLLVVGADDVTSGVVIRLRFPVGRRFRVAVPGRRKLKSLVLAPFCSPILKPNLTTTTAATTTRITADVGETLSRPVSILFLSSLLPGDVYV